jgi:uncharacterized protein
VIVDNMKPMHENDSRSSSASRVVPELDSAVMAAELLPSFVPIPSSVTAVAGRLPAAERARLEWFPDALRAAFIAPLAQASSEEFHAHVDSLLVEAVRIVLHLVADLGAVSERLGFETLAQAFGLEGPPHAWHDLIRQQLEPLDLAAADDLREAYEWLRAISSTIVISLSPCAGDAVTFSDAEIRRALVGEVRPFFRGLLLTIAALDVLERRQVPSAIAEWCQLAIGELHVTANALRAAGVPVPSDIQIPGISASTWRERRAVHRNQRRPPLLGFAPRGGACPPGAIDRIVEVLHPEQIWLFGSRARGTAGPESDWDLMVVVPDAEAVPPDDESWRALRDVRRQRIDLVPIHQAEFEADRREFGTLAHVATTTGRLVYGRCPVTFPPGGPGVPR